MVARWREEHLGFMFQPPKCFRVNDAVAVALKCRPHIIFGFGAKTAARFGASRRLGRQDRQLARFELLSDRGHAIRSFS